MSATGPGLVRPGTSSYAAGMRLFQVDAFADSVFVGNPAAVCLLEGPAEARWMQSVASEMNLSETARKLERFL